MEIKRRTFTNRDLALVAGMSGLYLAYGYASGVTFGHTIFELDLFFLISALFTILASVTGKPWSATILATINGLILLGDFGAPFAVSLSLIPNGVIFDLTIRAGNHIGDIPSKKRFVTAGALGNLAMAITGLIITRADGFLNISGIPLLAALAIAIVGNPLVGALGSLFGTVVVKRVGERVRSPLIR